MRSRREREKFPLPSVASFPGMNRVLFCDPGEVLNHFWKPPRVFLELKGAVIKGGICFRRSVVLPIRPQPQPQPGHFTHRLASHVPPQPQLDLGATAPPPSHHPAETGGGYPAGEATSTVHSNLCDNSSPDSDPLTE